MLRRLSSGLAAVALLAMLTACTSNPVAVPDDPTPPSTSAPAPGPSAALPSCESVTEALGSLTDGLEFNADASAAQTIPEAYDQQVCVYTTTDLVTQIGVTLASIPFQQGEIDSYATLPNAIADDRLAQYQGVIQTLAPGDGDDDILDSALYLFDTTVSITIQGISTAAPIAQSIPQLTLPAAIDAAFAVRALMA